MNLKFLKIPSLCAPEELQWLAQQAREHFWIVEVGSWKGAGTRALADNTPGTVYAVDTFRGTPGDGHMKELEGKPQGWLFGEFMANVQDLIPQKLHVMRMSSIAASSKIGISPDMVFIDGAHDYENVKSDIKAWSEIMMSGGMLCGHDFEEWRGVPRAVKELVPDFQRGPGTIWFR